MVRWALATALGDARARAPEQVELGQLVARLEDPLQQLGRRRGATKGPVREGRLNGSTP